MIVRILKINPAERLTIDEIFSHQWFNSEEGGESVPPVVETGQHQVVEGFDQVGISEIDEMIMAGMEVLGMDVIHLRQSLSQCQPDQLSALFFLLKKAKASPALPYTENQYFPRLQKTAEDRTRTPDKGDRPTLQLSKSQKAEPSGSSQSKSGTRKNPT